MTQTRREFLRGAGLAVAAAGGASMPALAQEGEYPHWDAQPEHVTLAYDEQTLLNYAPRLIFEQEAREKFMGLYGWTATSPEYDLDWHVYVAKYTNQQGVSPFGAIGPSDSHLGDHEWYYVASDPETGETDRVVYDAYHWLAGKLRASDITMDGTHPVAKIVSPWHPYSHFDIDEKRAVAIESITDLTAKFDGILANGLAESLQPGTAVDPAWMDIGGRSHWWQNTVGEFSFDAFYAKLLYDLGFAGADSVDSGALEI
jgi:hypothetical protein